jgi:hypothetical protein
MATLYVARSTKFCRWASDVGLGKFVFKVGVAEGDPKELAAQGWAGETDWTIVGKETVAGLPEAEVLERLAKKEKLVEPRLYPKLKGTPGVFRLTAAKVENHILVTRALSGEAERLDKKLKPADFARYLIANATR